MKLSTLSRVAGVTGVVVSALLFLQAPSFPTPDKLFILLLFVFMAYGQAWDLFKKLAPFIVLLLVYESFRGLVPHLNTKVNFTFMIEADKILGLGTLPTIRLQSILWQGSAQWYDYLIYLVYMLHFVLPLLLAILIWKKRPKHYWRYITAFISLSFAGFLTFLAFPAAPPWMASDLGYIPQIQRVSSAVFEGLGLVDFPSVYNKISPNPVAAMPSLHAAYATLLAIFVWKLFGRKFGLLACIYPAIIYFGTVYQGEHYLIDELAGGVYALAAYLASPYILRWVIRLWALVVKYFSLVLGKLRATIEKLNN